jgi:hypothetical protein
MPISMLTSVMIVGKTAGNNSRVITCTCEAPAIRADAI